VEHTTNRRSITRAGRGVSRVDVLFGAGARAVLTCVAVTMPMRGGGGLDSQYKLAELAQANECYANDFAGRRFGVMPADAGAFGDSCTTYVNASHCPRQLVLGEDSSGAV
jgi:hypothetical protein